MSIINAAYTRTVNWGCTAVFMNFALRRRQTEIEMNQLTEAIPLVLAVESCTVSSC